MQNLKQLNSPVKEERRIEGTTAWKIRIENEDLSLLKWIAEKFAEQDRGLIPKPSITALIHKAIKKYIEEALAALPRQHRRKTTHASPENPDLFSLPAGAADPESTTKPH